MDISKKKFGIMIKRVNKTNDFELCMLQPLYYLASCIIQRCVSVTTHKHVLEGMKPRQSSNIDIGTPQYESIKF